MRNGSKVWYCIRTSPHNAEVSTFDEPQEFVLRPYNRSIGGKSMTIQPKNGFTDRMEYGETTSATQRAILQPYLAWYGTFNVGDRFYLDGATPNENDGEYGENANYEVEYVAYQNEVIELSLKKIVNT